MKPLRIASFAGVGLAAVLVAGLLVYASGSDSVAAAAGAAPAPAAPRSIADCVLQNTRDVIIGGPLANPPCKGEVVMTPDPGAAYDEIYVARGGTLVISAGAGGSNVVNEPPVGIVCIGDGGTVRAGSKDNPVDNQHRFRLTFVGTSADKDEHQNSPCYGFSKGIDVTQGGSLLLYGAEGVPGRCSNPNDSSTCEVSWTTLLEPAGPRVAGAKFEPPAAGTTTLHLSADVKAGPDPWQQGDWIVVATTNYVPFDSEFVQIKDVEPGPIGGSTVTLEPGEGLKYYHFGSLAPSPATETCPDPLYPAHSATATQPAFLCDGAGRNYGVDERAEVGLVSRDIELTARTSGNTDHWGGEIKIHEGFAHVVLQGVRISKFGKDQLGSYPIHFHLVGNAQGKPLVDADSVDHSYNKCVTIHSTSNLAIRDLVCARIVGHIFYEELQDANAANPADDSGLVFDHDLGIGAMSNRFDIYGNAKKSREALINEFWWAGDYMTNQECATLGTCINYHAFNIPDTDNWRQSVRGSCGKYEGRTGGWAGWLPPNAGSTTAACPPADPNLSAYTIYIEPAMGFWIQNPRTVLENDAIAGCQGVGKAFEWLSPVNVILDNGSTVNPKFFPLGRVENDRASACYAGFYDEPEYSEKGEQLFAHKGGLQDAPSIVATLDGITATRNRFRGAWLRPTWFVIKDGHFASNRENVTLVTSGGLDGNAPGVWELLEDSVLVGFSANNVDRWGPCPQKDIWGEANTGWKFGCVDSTPPPPGTNPHSGAAVGEGYEPPYWNDFGYMLYDGPVRLVHDRFVNFNYNTAWTAQAARDGNLECEGPGWAFNAELDGRDCDFLKNWSKNENSPTGLGPPTPYEGDAALGWFQNNQSAYPTATAAKELLWKNTNLRHQIYTNLVNLGDFNDGDKNTAIIDEDGTLSGMGVERAPNAGTRAEYPISLNNLPFNAPFATSANRATAVDECLSRGGQNDAFEGRDSSLMSPADMGTLEFSDLYPFYNNLNNLNPPDNEYPGANESSHWQNMTFRRDDAVPNGNGGTYHPEMVMQTGRNGLGIWEPKVINGFGYTVKVARTTARAAPPELLAGGKAGIWKWIEVGLADVVDPNIRPGHPFFIRLGIDYMDKNGDHPPDKSYFTVTRGYKSYWGGNIWEQDPELLKYWTKLDCHGLDSQNRDNVPRIGHPAKCPAGPTTTLTGADSIDALDNDGTPNLTQFFYDSTTGYLYLNVAQDERNPVAPSPTGSCDPQEDGGNADPSCPHTGAPEYETYYACPKKGCIIYSIEVLSKNGYTYTPGPSSSNPPATADEKSPPPMDQQNKLENKTTNPPELIRPVLRTDLQGDPYYKAENPPKCDATQPGTATSAETISR